MNNFWRAIKLTLKYKFNIFWVLLSSICLALCWGGNIATVYPLVQVSFQGDSVRSWLEKEISSQNQRLDELQSERYDLISIADSNEDESDLEQKRLRLSVLSVQIRNTEKLLARYRFLQPYANRFTPNDPFLTVVILMVFVVVMTLIKSVCTFVQSFLSARLAQLASLELRAQFFQKMLGYETTYFSQQGISDATTRFTSDMGVLTNGLTLVYGKALREPLKMIVCLIGAAIISWRLLLFTFLFVPLAAALIRWLAKSLKRVARRVMMEMAQLYGRLDETFHAIKVVKSFNREDYEFEKFRRSNETYYRRGMKMAKYDSLTSPITECLGIGMLAVAIVAGANLIIYQKTSLFGIQTSSSPLDLGSLILFYGFLIGASDPARRLTDIFTNIQNACAASDRVYEVIDRESKIVESKSPKRLERFTHAITFENVSYEYPIDSGLSVPAVEVKKTRVEKIIKNWIIARWNSFVKKSPLPSDVAAPPPSSESVSSPDVGLNKESRRVLRNVSLEIAYGETIAIVGRSGCGKSTLLSMIPRFIDPLAGRVLLDGVPLTELSLSDLRDQIGLVAQDSVLFNESVFDNILYGRPDATREEVIAAAQDAYADAFIREELSDGYDTIVGPGGGALSGGQRQRVALARAILKNPRIFLLDEATSQIDLQSERFIHQALKKFVGSRTTILVTHRLSAIELADRIVVMQDGEIQFIGTHEDALKQSAFYANLWATESFDEAAR